MVPEPGQGKYKLSVEHLVVSGSRKCSNKKDGNVERAQKPAYERAASNQVWNNLSNKITIVLDYNTKDKYP